MIEYKFDEEKEYILHYANKLHDNRALDILNSGNINSMKKQYISQYFWRMVDSSIEDEDAGIELPWPEGAEFWNEKIMNTLSGYLERTGYESEWDSLVDEQ